LASNTLRRIVEWHSLKTCHHIFASIGHSSSSTSIGWVGVPTTAIETSIMREWCPRSVALPSFKQLLTFGSRLERKPSLLEWLRAFLQTKTHGKRMGVWTDAWRNGVARASTNNRPPRQPRRVPPHSLEPGAFVRRPTPGQAACPCCLVPRLLQERRVRRQEEWPAWRRP